MNHHVAHGHAGDELVDKRGRYISERENCLAYAIYHFVTLHTRASSLFFYNKNNVLHACIRTYIDACMHM